MTHRIVAVRRSPRIVVALLLTALLVAGCSATALSTAVSPSPSARATQTPPTGTATMATLGWKNAPAERVVLPIGATIDRRVDQANVITAIGGSAMADSVRSTLLATLGSYGWTITASAGGSVLFSDATYDGAFTSDASVWALTIRVKA